MKALFIGGIKSGKSRLAEHYTLNISPKKPIYLATNEFFDEEMHKKVQKHKEQRAENFITLEEPLELHKALKESKGAVLIECVSMWINNMLYHKKSHQEIFAQMEQLLQEERDIVFVINDVSRSVVSEHKLVREFVELNGKVAQQIAAAAEHVFLVNAGIETKIK